MSNQAPPADAGLEPGRTAPEQRNPDQAMAALARGEGVTPPESADLVGYFLSNQHLPGDDDVIKVGVKVGHGDDAKEAIWVIHRIEWSEWQDARERATDEKTGEFDAYVAASYNVARALVEPKLGPVVAKLQEQDADTAPADAAVLLRRMFKKQSGTLLELSAKVLEISKLQNENASIREVDAGKT